MKHIIGFSVFCLLFVVPFFLVSHGVPYLRKDWIRIEAEVSHYADREEQTNRLHHKAMYSVDANGIEKKQETADFVRYSDYTIKFVDADNQPQIIEFTCKTTRKKGRSNCPILYMQGTKQMVTLFYNPNAKPELKFVFADREGKPLGRGNVSIFD